MPATPKTDRELVAVAREHATARLTGPRRDGESSWLLFLLADKVEELLARAETAETHHGEARRMTNIAQDERNRAQAELRAHHTTPEAPSV